MMQDTERFECLLSAGHPCIPISTFEEEDALRVVREAALQVGWPLWQWTIIKGISDGLVADGAPIPDTFHPAAALYHLSLQSERCITVMLDVVGQLKDERTLRAFRDLVSAYEKNGSHLVLIDHQEQLPPVVQAMATPFELSLPDEEELGRIVRSVLRARNERRRIQVDLSRQDADAVIQVLRGLNRRQVRQVVLEACGDDQRFNAADLPRMLAHKRRLMQGDGLLEYVEAPVSLEEIGGLRKLKDWLMQRQQVLSTQAAEFGLTAPRGVLMLGVQGAGKSLAAKAVATAWRWPLLRLDVGALYDRFIGESERRLREALREAERMAPMILWIDEIEKGFASAASQSVDGGLSRRMFGNLLTWMQEHTAPVFVIATANDIEALPPELLRKGRFDEIFFVDLPTREAREQILAIHIRKRRRDPGEFDLPALAAAAEGFSGAEIEQAVVAGLHDAFAAGGELSTGRILRALQVSPPLSVTMAERVAALRQWAQRRCVVAD